mgnify:CR=1 FL=1
MASVISVVDTSIMLIIDIVDVLSIAIFKNLNHFEKIKLVTKFLHFF